MNWLFVLVLIAVSYAFCSIGFKKGIWFLSVGYGLAVFGIGLASVVIAILNQLIEGGILGLPQYDLTTNLFPFILILVQAVVFIVYGLRLGLFILIREIKSVSYNKEFKKALEKDFPLSVKFLLWISVGLLYFGETVGLTFRIQGATTDIVLPIIAIAISIIGIILEAVGDAQKSAQKKENPTMVATKGLYKYCRCPNYFGEILFWTGVFVSGILAYQTIVEWIIAVLSYICIVYVMFDGAKRLEKRQQTRLKDNKEYFEYANKTPIIIPFIPIYHLYNEDKEAKKNNKK